MPKITQLPKNPCQICKKKEAKWACDFIISEYRWIGHPPKINGIIPENEDMTGTYTCDCQLCDDCTTKIENNDYCPKCTEMLYRTLKIKKRRNEDDL